jgi:hypothetical protein
MKAYGFGMPFFTKKSGWYPIRIGKPRSVEEKACERWHKRLARRLGKMFIKEQVEEPSKSHTG